MSAHNGCTALATYQITVSFGTSLSVVNRPSPAAPIPDGLAEQRAQYEIEMKAIVAHCQTERIDDLRAEHATEQWAAKKKHKSEAISEKSDFSDIASDQMLGRGEQEWVQCEVPECGKWRALPPHIQVADLPDCFACEHC
jgi:hypothetical protein